MLVAGVRLRFSATDCRKPIADAENGFLLFVAIPLSLSVRSSGLAKHGRKDQRRFFHIALGSLRECQAILVLEDLESTECWRTLDVLGAHLHRLIERM